MDSTHLQNSGTNVSQPGGDQLTPAELQHMDEIQNVIQAKIMGLYEGTFLALWIISALCAFLACVVLLWACLRSSSGPTSTAWYRRRRGYYIII